jgi:uncharacterized membrane protein YgdD (TMEM256/DUF423 family)
MHKPFFIAGAALAGLAVILGAFGAHGLEKVTMDEKILHSYQTGVQYQLYHALALLITAIVYFRFPFRSIKWAGNCFITGIFLFSGSLYLLTFLKIQDSTAIRFAGPVTPLGGVFFIAGWLLLLIGVSGIKTSDR